MSVYPLYIMGFMASGKSTFGRKLAASLEVNFIETDRLIEEREKKSIQQIFEERGEAYFRKLESEVLRQFDGSQQAVIALGGGTPCTLQNIKWIRSHGSSIYLKLSPELLIGRLRQNKHKRPLTQSLNDEEISQFVYQKLEERRPFYEKANYSIEAKGISIKEVIKLLNEGG